ncbi:glycoprotein integral membrane 1 [Phyllostomus discolor]|uniref:Glycoprotein integral membrane 1 n=1 Tax=Phyllostomus discolor TaxID=89673 RepID=A0A834AM77_9CHIR|nr:glycoprotein integral membrane 1 [Phyllostomus discolor]
MEGARLTPFALRLLLLAVLPATGWLKLGVPEPPPLGAPQESIRINVTTLKDDGEVAKEQVVLNVTYESGQVYVNEGVLQLDKVNVIPVAAISLHADSPEKTAENLEYKTCI